MSTTPFAAALISHQTSSANPGLDIRRVVMLHAVRAVAAAAVVQVYLGGGLCLRLALLAIVDGALIGLVAPLVALSVGGCSRTARAAVTLWNTAGMASLAAMTSVAVELALSFPHDVAVFTRPANLLITGAVWGGCVVSHAWVLATQLARRRA